MTATRFQPYVPGQCSVPTDSELTPTQLQVAYGLGTANSKRGGQGIDENIVNVTVKALQAGFTHLDCAEGESMRKRCSSFTLGLATNL